MMNDELKRRWWSVPVVSVIAGLAIWWGVSAFVHDVDPMQHKEYIEIGYPLLLVFSVALGLRYGASAWHCGIWMFGGQLLMGLFTINCDLNLWPIGLLIFVALAALCCVAALIGAFLRKRIFRNSK